MEANKTNIYRLGGFALFFLLGLLVASFFGNTASTPKPQQESVYDHVIRTGVIRCGYAVWPPVIVRDPNTGELSGIFHDYVEALGRALHVKIEWAKEIDMGTYIQDLNDRKFDLECAGGWPDALRGKQLYYTRPIFYLPYYLYARADDSRFDRSLEAINAPDVRFATMDGDFSSIVHDEMFPQANVVSLPSTVSFSELLMAVSYNKADVTSMDAFSGEPFLQANPGKLHRIPLPPLRIIPNNLSVPRGETDFLNMLNTATDALINDGVIDRILDKYSLQQGSLFRIGKPYEVQRP